MAHLQQLAATSRPGLAERVLDIFLRDTAARLVALREALLQRDQQTVCDIAHTLHGSTSTLGAVSLAKLCIDLIDCARDGAFDRCETMLLELEASFESVRRAVRHPVRLSE